MLQLISPLLIDAAVLLLLLLPGYVASEAFMWRSGIRYETTQLYQVLWSVVVGVLSLPILLGVFEALGWQFPAVTDPESVVLLLVVVAVAFLVGTATGDWYRVRFKRRYGATPSLNTGWGYLHHRSPNALVRVVTTDGTEVIGRVKFVGQTSPHENVELRDLLLRKPCVLSSNRSGSTPTNHVRFLHLYGDEIAQLHVISDLSKQIAPHSNYWAMDVLLRWSHWLHRVLTVSITLGRTPEKSEPSGDPLRLSNDTVVTGDGETRKVTGKVRNHDDEAHFGEVTVTFRGPDDEFLSSNHDVVPALESGTETTFEVPYDGPRVDGDLDYTAAVTVRNNVQIPEKPTLRSERRGSRIEFPIRNVTAHKTVHYCVVRVRVFATDGGYLEDRFGSVGTIPPRETAVIPVRVPKPESEFRFGYRIYRSYVTE